MTTTAEIAIGLTMSEGSVWTLSIEQNRNPLARGGLGKGTRAGSLVGTSLIELLRSTADFMEQEGVETLDELATSIDDATGHNDE